MSSTRSKILVKLAENRMEEDIIVRSDYTNLVTLMGKHFAGSDAISDKTYIGRRKAVPVLYVQGSHYEIGFDVGRYFAATIKNFIATYKNLRDFEREYKTQAGKTLYNTTLENMKKKFPYYIKEIQGTADGAKVPFETLFLLQLDDLIGNVNDNHVPRNDTGGCSSIGVLNSEYSILGHTEDAFSETLNHFYILSAHIIPTPEDRQQGATEERFSGLCYAGHMPGYTMQHNENGLVYSINTLSPNVLKFGSTPRTFITRKLLSARNFAEAEKILADEGLGAGNGFSVNMIWSDTWSRRQMYNIEVAPNHSGAERSLLNIQKYGKDVLVHCNLYQRLSVKEVAGPLVESSVARLNTIKSYSAPQSRQEVKNILSDSSADVFQIFQEKKGAVINTIAVGIFDLNQRSWSIYINKPNISEPVAVLPLRFTQLENEV